MGYITNLPSRSDKHLLDLAISSTLRYCRCLQSASDKAKGAVDSAKDNIKEAAGAVKDKAGDAKDFVKDKAGDVKDTAKDLVGKG
jgi:ElaB/YqjD/DUF883 family membrane-anchored ribosome-binding protein